MSRPGGKYRPTVPANGRRGAIVADASPLKPTIEATPEPKLTSMPVGAAVQAGGAADTAGRPGPATERPAPVPVSDPAGDWSLSIDRTIGAVVVKVAGKVTEAVTLTLEHVLHDLIDGQGNVLVAVELPESVVSESGFAAMIAGIGVGVGPARRLVVTPVSDGVDRTT
jgi:hypothetical protein